MLLLGSSEAFGESLDYERSLGAMLERGMARRGLDADLFNLSQPSYSSSQARRLFEDWAPRIRPDVVLVVLGHAESLPAFPSGDDEALLPLIEARLRSRATQERVHRLN